MLCLHFASNINSKQFVSLDPISDYASDATWQATGSSLQSAAVQRHIESSSTTIHHYAFLSGQDHSGAIGIAYLGTACLRAPQGKRCFCIIVES